MKYSTTFHLNMIRFCIRMNPCLPGMPTPLQLAPHLFLTPITSIR